MKLFVVKLLQHFKNNKLELIEAQMEEENRELIEEFRALRTKQSPTEEELNLFRKKMQTTIVVRLKWYRTLLNCLYKQGFYESTRMDHLEAFLDNNGLLGSGSYGSVYKSSLKKQVCSPLSVAVKVEEFRRSNAQLMCSYFMNMLVMTAQVPYLTLTLPPVYVESKGKIMELTIMELSDMSLKDWLNNVLKSRKPADAKEYFSLYFQIFWTIATMGAKYQAVHDDLYPRNVLLSYADLDAIKQDLIANGTKYVFTVKSYGLIVKLSDFGFCSTPQFKDYFKTTRHDYLTYGQKPFTSVRMLYDNHVTLLDLPRYARDILSITASFSSHFLSFSDLQKHKEIALLNKYMQKIMDHVLQKVKLNTARGYLNNEQDLIKLFTYFLNPFIMGKELSESLGFDLSIEKINKSN